MVAKDSYILSRKSNCVFVIFMFSCQSITDDIVNLEQLCSGYLTSALWS